MRNKKLLLLIFPFIILVAGCNLLYFEGSNVKVFSHTRIVDKGEESLVIFNFKEPAYARDIGVMAAEVTQQLLLASKKFRVVKLYNSSSWTRMGETEEDRIENALYQAGDLTCAYILVGEVIDFMYGNINRSKVKVRMRLIRLDRKTTVFYAENSMTDHDEEKSYPLDTKLVEKSEDVRILLKRVISQIIKRI